MAEEPKGSLWYKILIAIFTIALLFTILYPKNTWNKQDELQAVCRSRMEAIQQAEYQYLNLVNMYEDTLVHLISAIKADTSAMMALDTTIQWDGIVQKADLKEMVMEQSFPEDLRHLISLKMNDGLPLGNLAKWDSLEYRLIACLEKQILMADTTVFLDSLVHWRALMGSDSRLMALYENTEIPRRLKTNSRVELRRQKPVYEVPAWKYLRDTLFIILDDIVEVAKMEDVWSKEEKDDWEEETRAAWEEEMDAMSAGDKDSLWLEYQEKFWDKESDQIWKKDRKTIWRKEGDQWKEDNKDTWMRIVENEWKLRTKKEWIEEKREGKPDSVIQAFDAIRDSLWRVEIDSIKEANFKDWQDQEKKFVNDKIDDIWDRERRAQWEPDAKQIWLEQKRKTFDTFWSDLKEGVWNDLRYELWEAEEKKMAQKKSALAALDRAVPWKRVIGGKTEQIIANLDLPDNKCIWNKIDTFDPKKGSALIAYGIAPLFSSALLDSVYLCPEVHIPYKVEVEDTTIVKKFSITCPIQEKEYEKYVLGFRAPIVLLYQGETFIKAKLQYPFIRKAGAKKSYIEQLDPVTGEVSEVELKTSAIQNIFGAKKITPHGKIDMDGKKSWLKRGN